MHVHVQKLYVIVSLSRIQTYVPLGFIGRYLSKPIILAVAFASCSMLICRYFLQSHKDLFAGEAMESSRFSALFMAAFIVPAVAALKIGLVLARGSCDIFPTQRLAFNLSSGDIVLPQRLV